MEDMSVIEMKTEGDKLTNKSLKSTRRILQMAEECQNTGGKTMDMLDKQGNQLKNAEGDLDEIKENMSMSLPMQQSIENDQRYEQVWGTEQKDEGLVSSQVTAVHKKRRIFGQSAPPSGPYIKKITNDAREDEMEKNLEQVGSIIGNLKIMAADMGHEFDKQNEIIDRVSSKAEINIHHIDAATKKAEQLIKE